MAPPYQIPSSAQQKRKYTMLDDYVNAIQWENVTNVSATPRLGTTPTISPQERGDFPVERSQLSFSSSSRMQQQQHTSLFSLLGLPIPASAPMFHSSEIRVDSRDPTFPIAGMSVPSAPMASLSRLRVLHSDATVPSSESSVPFSATMLPCSGPMFSLPGTRVPRCDTIVPSSEISVPFRASMPLPSGTRVPYNDSMLLLSGTRAPQGDAMVPSSDISVPMNASMLPPLGTRVPYGETMTFSGTRVPCSGAMVPFSERNVPFSASMLPLAGTRVPSSDPIFPLPETRIPYSDPMFLPSEISVSSSPMFSSSGWRLPHHAPMFPSSEISVPFGTSMLSLSRTSDPMFLPSEISGPYGGPMFSSPEISARMFPSSRISASFNTMMFPSSGIRAPCNNVPLFSFSGIESHSNHQSNQQNSLLHVSPEVHYYPPRMLPLLAQHESLQESYPTARMASSLLQHGRAHNIENTKKKARVFETGSSSDQGASVSPIAEQLKTVTEFSQLLNEISVPNSTADDLSEDKLLVNSYIPIDSVWNTNRNTVDDNTEIEKMNNWWEKSYGHESK